MKTNIYKKAIVVIVAIIFSLTALMACDNDVDNNGNNDNDLSGTININIPIGNNELIALQKAVSSYRLINPYVNINITQQDGDSYSDWLAQQLASDTSNITADIVMNNEVAQFFSANKFVDYSDYLTRSNPYADNQMWRDVLMEPAYRANGSRGEIYSLNFESTQIVFFYNKKIFQQAGLTVDGTTTGEPRTPATWDELINFSSIISQTPNSGGQGNYSALAIAGNATSFWSGQMGWLIRVYADQYFRSFINDVRSKPGDFNYNNRIDANWQYKPLPSDFTDLSEQQAFEAAIYNDSPSNVTVNLVRVLNMLNNNEIGPIHPKYQDMLVNLKKMIPLYTQPGFAGSDINGAYDAFWSQRAAMCFIGTDFYKSYHLYNDGLSEEQKMQIGTFYCPPMTWAGTANGQPDVDITRSVGGPQGYYGVINKNQKQNDLVMDFMMYWASKQGQEIIFDSFEEQGWYINGKVFINDIEIPDSIHPSKDLIFQGESDLNPIQFVARGLGAEPLSLRDFQVNIVRYFNGELTVSQYASLMQNRLKHFIPHYLADRGFSADSINNPALNPYED